MPRTGTPFPRARRDGDYDHPVEEEAPTARGRFPKGAVVRLVVATTVAFVLGWAIAYNGWIPGVFTAADLGMPTLFVLALRLVTKTMEAYLDHETHLKAATAVPKGAAWAIGMFWAVLTVTTVPMLAFGLAVGILGYAVYSARLQLRTLGHDGLGAGTGPALVIVGAWFLWAALHQFLGPVPGFSVASAVYGGAVVAFVARRADRAAQEAAVLPARVAHSATEDEARRASEKRILVGILIAYLVFRLFLSARLPYGPIVEWMLICIGILFFSIMAANRIGVVPTERALPPSDVRRHIQVVSSLPDRRLAETEARIRAFIDQGVQAGPLAATFERLYDDLGVPAHHGRPILDRFSHAASAERQGRRARHGPVTTTERRALVADACRLLRDHRTLRDATGTLKTDRAVRKTGSFGAAA